MSHLQKAVVQPEYEQGLTPLVSLLMMAVCHPGHKMTTNISNFIIIPNKFVQHLTIFIGM